MAHRRILPGLFLAAILLPLPALAGPPLPGAPAPPAAGASLLQQGRAHQAVGEYDEAAAAFESFARQSPNDAEAPDALQDAIVLRLGMSQTDAASKDAELFAKSYGAKRREQVETIDFALARHVLDHGDYAAAKTRFEAWVKAFDAAAPVDLRIQVHAGLGHVFVETNKADKAAAEYRVVVDLWRDPGAAVRALGDGPNADRRIARALTAVGEALFFFAEQKRREAETIHFPAYKGPSTRDDVLKHISTKVVDWVKQKRPALEAAEKEYKKILDLQPMPPPRWVVASASRVGQMWARFVAEFRAAPIPKEWKGHGPIPGVPALTYDDIRGEFYAKLDEASAPQKRTAKAAFKSCLDYSAKFQFFDAYSRTCEHWLAKNYETEYHLTAELLPRWGRLGPATPPSAPLPDPR